MDIVIGRTAINQAACVALLRPNFALSISLALGRVTREWGAGIYTPRYIYSQSSCRRSMGPALSYTLYIRGAFTILATGPGQVLFFIDSFDRAFGHAGTLSPVPIFSLREKIERTKESERE